MTTPDFPLIEGEYKALAGRAISKETCEFFSYSVGTAAGKAVHIADYKDPRSNKTYAQKIRGKDKKFYITGDSKKLGLYGQWLWSPTNKLPLVVVEGEMDALSIVEACGRSWPVVSIAKGSKSAAQELENNLEWLLGWRCVILCLDNDEAGQSATQEIIEKLGTSFAMDQLKVARLPMKDANEMLVAGKNTELRLCLVKAEAIQVDSVIQLSDLVDEILEPPKQGLAWPWASLQKRTYGLKPGDVVVVCAGAGIGKTEFIKDTILHLLHKNEKVGLLSFEYCPAESAKRLIGSMLNKRIHVPGVSATREEILQVLSKINENLFIYDHKGIFNLDRALSRMKYMAQTLKCKVIALDPFTALTVGMDDERRDIDKVMPQLKAFAETYGCSLLTGVHLSKPMGSRVGYEEGLRVSPSALRGSQSLQYWPTLILALERNKFDEDPNNRITTKVRVLKDRFTGDADGLTIELKYDSKSGKLIENEAFKGII